MKVVSTGPDVVTLEMNEDDLLTLRGCVVETIHARGDHMASIGFPVDVIEFMIWCLGRTARAIEELANGPQDEERLALIDEVDPATATIRLSTPLRTLVRNSVEHARTALGPAFEATAGITTAEAATIVAELDAHDRRRPDR